MTKTIKIAGIEFTVSAPYGEGNTINGAEAAVLNQTRAENIGNNFRKQVAEAKDDAEKMAKVQADIAAYDATYNFATARTRSGGSSPRLSPLEAEAMRVAKAWLQKQLSTAGKTLKAYKEEKGGEEGYKAKLAEIASNEAIIAIAKKNLAAASKTPELAVAI